MARLDGSSTDGGRPDEADLLEGKGIPSDGYWNELGLPYRYNLAGLKPDISYGSSLHNRYLRRIMRQLFFRALRRFLWAEIIHHLLIPTVFKCLIMWPKTIAHLLIRTVFKSLVKVPELLAHLLMQPELLVLLLMQPELLLGCPIIKLNLRECMLALKMRSHGTFGRSSKPFIGEQHHDFTEKIISNNIPAKPRPEYDDGFFLHSRGYHSATANAIGNPAKNYKIYMVSPADNGDNHQRATNSDTNQIPEVILDTGAAVSITGDRAMFGPLQHIPEGYVLYAANGEGMTAHMFGLVNHEMFRIKDVYFIENLGPRTIISGPELDLFGCSYKFKGGLCEVWDDRGTLIGRGRLDNGRYVMDFLKVPFSRAPVPLSEQPALVTSLWTAVRTVCRWFANSLPRRDSTQARERLPL